MGLIDSFTGAKDMQQRCSKDKKAYLWTIYPKVKVRSKADTAKVGGISFQVDVDAKNLEIKAVEGDDCFTLVFDDENDYAATITHKESGFTASAERSKAKNVGEGQKRSDVELSKTSDLCVVVKEKWPDGTECPFGGVKIGVKASESTADKEGKHESKGLALDVDSLIKLGIKGVDKAKCEVTIKTELASTKDGFLKEVKATEEKKEKAEIKLADQPGATVTVTFVVHVGVVTPKIKSDPIALLDYKDKDYPTSFSEMLAELETKHPLDDLAEIEAALTFDDKKISCFEDDKGTKAYTSGTAVEPKKLAKLYVQGTAAGECELTLKLSTKRKEADRSWRIKGDKGWKDQESDEAKGMIWVEQLDIGAFKYAEGKSVSDNTSTIKKPPKTRDLHNQNQDNSFTVAKLSLQKPSDEFWKRAAVLKLSAGENLDVKCTENVTELKKESFKDKKTLQIWVKATGATALDQEDASKVDWDDWEKLDPEKVTTRCHVSLGVKVDNKPLLNGDCVTFNAFAFDVHLDRKTRNECGRRVEPDPKKYNLEEDDDVALACAGGHQYYDLLSEFHVNKNYPGNGQGSLFSEFLKKMNASQSQKEADLAKVGMNFVADHLKKEHTIILCATVKKMIESYIKKKVSKQNYSTRYGFDYTRGVPGVHAEVLAVNEVLSRGLGIGMANVTVATYKLQIGKEQGKRFVACINCRGILLEGTETARVITG